MSLQYLKSPDLRRNQAIGPRGVIWSRCAWRSEVITTKHEHFNVQYKPFNSRGNMESLPKAAKRQPQFVVARRKLPQLQSVAAEIFAGEVTVDIESDPEIPDCQYLVFNVSAPANKASVMRKEWYRRTQDILKNCSDKVRLSISAE